MKSYQQSLLLLQTSRNCKWKMSEAHSTCGFLRNGLYYISIETLMTSDSSDWIAFLNCFHLLILLLQPWNSLYCLKKKKNILKLKCHNLGLAFLPSVWFQGCSYKARSLKNCIKGDVGWSDGIYCFHRNVDTSCKQHLSWANTWAQ